MRDRRGLSLTGLTVGVSQDPVSRTKGVSMATEDHVGPVWSSFQTSLDVDGKRNSFFLILIEVLTSDFHW